MFIKTVVKKSADLSAYVRRMAMNSEKVFSEKNSLNIDQMIQIMYLKTANQNYHIIR